MKKNPEKSFICGVAIAATRHLEKRKTGKADNY
jgi:hypothetical protein